MLLLLIILLAVPFFSGCFIAFGGNHPERLVSRVAITTVTLYVIVAAAIVGTWVLDGQHHTHLNEIAAASGEDFRFPISFFFDSMGATFLVLISFFCRSLYLSTVIITCIVTQVIRGSLPAYYLWFSV